MGYILFVPSSLAQEKTAQIHQIYIPKHDAATALNMLAEQTSIELLFPYEQARKVNAKPVVGKYNLMQALALMLDGTGLSGYLSEQGMLNIRFAEPVKKSLATGQTVPKEQAAKRSDDEQAEKLEVITIKGFRSSLVKSINNKRFSDDVIDTIDAEDVGKFPDANIAESLQRIAGISIDRSGGEGQFITIRGLGPEFNSILLNGRKMASTTGGRAFSLDTLASEINSSIDAYKSSNAQLIDGGLGGTVDIKTARPFDYQGFNSAVSIKGLYSDSSDEIDPQYSLLVSDSFFADRLGILAAVNHQERSQKNTAVRNFVNNSADLLIQQGAYWQEMPVEDIEKNTLKNVTSPQSLDRDVMNEFRERTGANLVVQYQANHDLLMTFDALYSTFNVSSSGYSANNWFWYPTAVELDEEDSAVWLQHGASGFATAYRERQRPTKTSLFGANIDWSITDNINANIDLFVSKAMNENKGLNKDIIVEMITEEYVEYDYRAGGDYPILKQPLHTIPSQENAHLLHPRKIEFRGVDVDAKNIGAQVDFAWHSDFEIFKELRFGVHYNRNKKDNNAFQVAPEVTSLYAANSTLAGLYIPDSLVNIGQLNGGWTGITDNVHKINTDEYLQWLIDPETVTYLEENSSKLISGEAQELLDSNHFFEPNKMASSFQVDEKITAFYLQARSEFELSNMPLTVLAGLRYSQTQLSSEGIEHLLADIKAVVDDGKTVLESTYVSEHSNRMITVNNDYHAWLPSIKSTLHLSNELQLRGAFSKTLARPALDDLSLWIEVDEMSVESRAATAANPKLTPYLSTNVDISLEWYYSPDSMLSVAGFGKHVKDWIIQTTHNENLDLVSHEYQSFAVTRPNNNDDVDIYGIELNWIHSFDNGLGFQTNATFVDSNNGLGEQHDFNIEGLSDSANIVAFYEKKALQIRLAYNIRAAFLQDNFWQGGTEPMYVGRYKQFDASASYKLYTNFTLFFEGINLFDEKTHKYGRQHSQFLEYSETGARYALGLRATF